MLELLRVIVDCFLETMQYIIYHVQSKGKEKRNTLNHNTILNKYEHIKEVFRTLFSLVFTPFQHNAPGASLSESPSELLCK